MKSIDVVSKILSPLYSGDKELVCLCAKNARKSLLIPYCYGKQPVLPKPMCIYDICPENYNEGIDGIPVLPVAELKHVQDNKIVILIAAEDQLFYQYLGMLYDELHCYYIPILPCTAIEAYVYALEHRQEILFTAQHFQDLKSKEQYLDYWVSRIIGRVYDPMLYSGFPYWGNDVIQAPIENSSVVLGGAYNGLHIDRAFALTPYIKTFLFEPNPVFASILQKKYAETTGVHVIPKALYNTSGQLPFDNTDELGAHICTGNQGQCMVDAVRLDDLCISDVSEIALDVEGAEYAALSGAIETIQHCTPHLAICAYHKIEDYIKIPHWILDLDLNYQLYFRQHSCYYEESVVYAISNKK